MSTPYKELLEMEELKKQLGNNRIGSKCWYKATDVENMEWLQGTILAWSTDYEEWDSSPALFPVGVIEDNKTGEVLSISVVKIRFKTFEDNNKTYCDP